MPNDPLSQLTNPAGDNDLVKKHADRTGLDPELVRRVVRQESGGNPRARSWANAQGSMQLMPGTAKRYGVKDLRDPDQNIRGGTDYLRDLMTEFNDPKKALAAYNAGEGAVRKHGYDKVRKFSNFPKGDPRRGKYQGSTGEYVDKIAGDYKGTGWADDPLTALTKTGDAKPSVSESDPLSEIVSSAAQSPSPIRPSRFAAPRQKPSPRMSRADIAKAYSVKPDPFSNITGGAGPVVREIPDAPGSNLSRVFRRKAELPVYAPKIEIKPRAFNFKAPSDEKLRADLRVEVANEVASSTPRGRMPRLVNRELDAEVEARLSAIKEQQRLNTEAIRTGPAMSARQPGLIERVKTAIAPFTPGLTQLDKPMGIKTDVLRGAARGLTLGAVGDSRQITPEELIARPDAETRRNFAEGVGETATAFVPYVAAGKAVSMIPALNRAGRAVAAARTGATFGGVETAREGIRAAKTGEAIDPTEIAVSTAIGAAMGAIPGVNAGLKQRIFAAVAPQVVADVARGRTMEEAAQGALTNLLFEAAGHRKLGVSKERFAEIRKQIESRQTVPSEIQRRLDAGAETQRSTPSVASNAEARAFESNRPESTSVAADGPTVQKFQHLQFGEVTAAESQSGVGRGRVRVVDNSGTEHVIQKPTAGGRGNERAIPVKEVPAAEPRTADLINQRQSASASPEAVQPEGVVKSAPSLQGEVAKPEKNLVIESAPPSAAFPVESKTTVERAANAAAESVVPVEAEGASRGAGQGGNPPAPVIPAKPPTTAVKNASMTADRVAMELPELAQSNVRGAAEVHAKAKAANQANPRATDVLTEQALQGDKNFTDIETAQVRLRAQEIKNRESELLREIDATNDPSTIKDKRVELNALTEEFDRLSQGTRLAGTEWGRAGVARQQAIDQDFALVSMKARLKADKGAPLTEKENTQIEDLHRKLGEAEKRAEVAEERAIQAEFQRTLDKASRQRKRSETKATLDQEVVVIKQNILAELSRIKSGNIHASGLAGIDPEGRLTKELIKYVHNRAKANIGLKGAELIDEAHDLVKDLGVTRRQVAEALTGYGRKSEERSASAKRVAEVNAEISKLLKEEDVVAGRRSPRQEGPKPEFTKNQTRLKQLEKEKSELERRMAEQDFSDKPKREGPRYTRETLAAQKEVEQIKAQYQRMRYRATRGRGGMISDELAKAANVPKTLKSIGDISAVFRQGGFYALTHPIEGGVKPFREMVKSVNEVGWRNVEAKIKEDPDFETLQKAGTEFTGVGKEDPQLSHREEGYLGKEYLDYIPIAKQIAGFSERTFVSFLDAQRLFMGKQMLKGMTDAQRRNPAELKAIARLINSGTGRGSLGRRGNALAPALNIAMFSPRLLASRVQLLNNMVNPYTIARMPPGARARMIADNVKFLAATGAIIKLAQLSGASVSLDPDDSEFLKIRFGGTVYDQLTGLQQPLRYLIRMGVYSGGQWGGAIRGGETYGGEDMAEITKQFARTKLNPALSPAVNFATGKDFKGRKFDWKREAKDLVVPLPANDVLEGLKQEGLIGALKATPTVVGIGVGSYPQSPEKPTTHAEKLARQLIRNRMPDTAREEEQIETDQAKSELRTRVRRGEDVSADIAALGAKITERQAKSILGARNKTRLQEDFNRLGVREAVIVFSVASPSQQAELREMLQKKSALIDLMPVDQQDEMRSRFEALGMQRGVLPRPERAERQQRSERKPREKQGYVFQ